MLRRCTPRNDGFMGYCRSRKRKRCTLPLGVFGSDVHEPDVAGIGMSREARAHMGLDFITQGIGSVRARTSAR